MPSPVIMGLGGDVFAAVAEGNVSGGQLLLAGSYTSTVTALSRAQYDYSKVKVSANGSGLNCVGVALHDVASGTSNEVPVIRKGLFILPAIGNVNAGRQIEPAAADGNGACTGGANAGRGIGRALTEAASGGQFIGLLNL